MINNLKSVSEGSTYALISSNACRLHAPCAEIFHSFSLFFFQLLFLSESFTLYLFIHIFLFYLYYTGTGDYNLLDEWLGWATWISTMSKFKWVRPSDDKRKACESGWYPCDSRRKFSIVGHLGKLVTPVTFRDTFTTASFKCSESGFPSMFTYFIKLQWTCPKCSESVLNHNHCLNTQHFRSCSSANNGWQ